jgi:hypothetical protein
VAFPGRQIDDMLHAANLHGLTAVVARRAPQLAKPVMPPAPHLPRVIGRTRVPTSRGEIAHAVEPRDFQRLGVMRLRPRLRPGLPQLREAIRAPTTDAPLGQDATVRGTEHQGVRNHACGVVVLPVVS